MSRAMHTGQRARRKIRGDYDNVTGQGIRPLANRPFKPKLARKRRALDEVLKPSGWRAGSGDLASQAAQFDC